MPALLPASQADGFIHLTKEPQLLLGVANHFYTTVPGTFLVLAIDSTKLSSKVGLERQQRRCHWHCHWHWHWCSSSAQQRLLSRGRTY